MRPQLGPASRRACPSLIEPHTLASGLVEDTSKPYSKARGGPSVLCSTLNKAEPDDANLCKDVHWPAHHAAGGELEHY